MFSLLRSVLGHPMAAVFLLMPFAPAATPGRTTPGVTFTTATTVTLSAGLQQMLEPVAITGRGVAVPGKSRVELEKVQNAGGAVAVGDILLASSPDGANSALTLRPSLRTYADLTAPLQDPLARLTADLGDGVRPGDVPAQFTHVGPGEQVEGRATQRHQLRTTYVAEAPGHSVSVSIVVDVWTAKLPFPVSNPLLTFGAATSTPIGVLRQKLASAFTTLGDGTPVRTVITTAMSVAGNSHEIVQTTTLTDIRPSAIDAALVVVPSGYTAETR
jgi:hypothetical protein